jgi:hypothetical protein
MMANTTYKASPQASVLNVNSEKFININLGSIIIPLENGFGQQPVDI